jgi:outer membrane protein TolC
VDAVDAEIVRQVYVAHAEFGEAEAKLRALEESSLPARRRAEAAALAGYEAGRASIIAFLMARQAVAETEVSVVEARAARLHALAELRWAAHLEDSTHPIGDTTEDVRRDAEPRTQTSQ